MHADHRLLPRHRETRPDREPAPPPVYSASGPTADPDERELIGRFPTFGLDGTIPGTNPEDMAVGWALQSETQLRVGRRRRRRRIPQEDGDA